MKIIKAIKSYTRKLSDELSAILFTNKAGLESNIEGLNRIKSSGGNTEHSIWSDGVIAGFKIDKDVINPIKEKYNQLIENPEYSISRGQGQVYSRSIKDIDKNIPEIKNILSEDVIEKIKEIYGCEFEVRHVIAWRNYSVPKDIQGDNKQFFSEKWHFDRRDISCIKLFVNLSDVTDDDGPFHILPVKDTKAAIKNGYKYRFNYGDSNPDNSEGLIKATGKVGSALICNTQICLHRAGVPENDRIRDIIQFQMFPSKNKLTEDWPEKIIKKDSEMRNGAN